MPRDRSTYVAWLCCLTRMDPMASRARHHEMATIQVDLCEVTPASVAVARAYVSPDEALRAARYRCEAQRACSILAHGIKRRQLSRETGMSAEQLRLTVSRHGKPVLECASPLSFNLAHTGRWVAFALSRQGEVGIDIEPVDRCFDRRLYTEALNDSERAAIEAAHDSALAFVICWTQKEAVLKALGEPMAYQPKRVCSTPRLGGSRATCGALTVHVMSWIELGCVISVASTLRAGAVRMTRMEPRGSGHWMEHVRQDISEVGSNPEKKRLEPRRIRC